MMTEVLFGVEGATDVPVAQKVIRHFGREPRQVLVARGKHRLDERIAKWNNSSNLRPFLVLRDWDQNDRAQCVPEHVRFLLGGALHAPNLLLRVPVRAVESWLMADRDGFAEFFKTSRVPASPESEARPKEALVNACRSSRSPTIRRDMLPDVGSRRSVGRLYEARIIEFGREHWDLTRAASNSPSLKRALDRIDAMITGGGW